jgi:hypothetical protein
MTTIALPQRKIRAINLPQSQALAPVAPFSIMAIASIACIGLFVGFLALYHTSMIQSLHMASKALIAFLFVVVAPGLALYFSAVSLHAYIKMQTNVRGMLLAYISFVISAVYFVTALAMPFILLGFYLLYVYIW